MTRSEFTASEEGERLDCYLFRASEGKISRSRAKKLIDEGSAAVNGKAVKAGYSLKKGDVVSVEVPEPKKISLQPENIPLDIVYEDEALAVINKQQGLTVHPSETQGENTLVNALLYHMDNLSGINGEIRPGIVHRLDKNTSGLIVVAKCDEAHRGLAKQLEDKTCSRRYTALLFGNVKQDEGRIETGIGRSRTDRKKMAVTEDGRNAITDFKVIERFGSFTLTEFTLKTGRTHQIRVHAKHMGHPVVGDEVYGCKDQPFKLGGQLLHAHELSFIHPVTGQAMTFCAPLPDYFLSIIEKLQKMQGGSPC